MQEHFYSNRSDFIRTAIRNQLQTHAEVVKQTVSRKTMVLGLRNYGRAELETLRENGQQIHVLGLASVGHDVSAELARATIDSVQVLGVFQASSAVKSALADRIK